MQAQGQKVQDSSLPFEKGNVRASPAPQPQQQQQQHVQQKQVSLAFFFCLWTSIHWQETVENLDSLFSKKNLRKEHVD